MPRWLAVGVMLLILPGRRTGRGLYDSAPGPAGNRPLCWRSCPTYPAAGSSQSSRPLLSKIFGTAPPTSTTAPSVIQTSSPTGLRRHGADPETLHRQFYRGPFRYLIAVLLVPIFTVSFLRTHMPELMASVRRLVLPRYQHTARDIARRLHRPRRLAARSVDRHAHPGGAVLDRAVDLGDLAGDRHQPHRRVLCSCRTVGVSDSAFGGVPRAAAGGPTRGRHR